MILKSLALTLAGAFVAASSISAGTLDDARSTFTGDAKSTYYEMYNYLDKSNTQDGKQSVSKLHDQLRSVYDNFERTQSTLDSFDSTLKSKWADLFKTEKELMVNLGILKSLVGTADYKSQLSTVKGLWEKFSDEFTKVYFGFVEYGKKFQNLCSTCR